MYKIKKVIFWLLLSVFIIIAGLVIYVVSPITHREKLETDYSDRYYELANKNPLTKEEREELEFEKRKGRTAIFKEYEEKYLNSGKKSSPEINEHDDN